MAIKICPECGGKVAETRNDCPHCGYVFPQMKVCPECNEKIASNCTTCPVCGHSFGMAQNGYAGNAGARTNANASGATFGVLNQARQAGSNGAQQPRYASQPNGWQQQNFQSMPQSQQQAKSFDSTGYSSGAQTRASSDSGLLLSNEQIVAKVKDALAGDSGTGKMLHDSKIIVVRKGIDKEEFLKKAIFELAEIHYDVTKIQFGEVEESLQIMVVADGIVHGPLGNRKKFRKYRPWNLFGMFEYTMGAPYPYEELENIDNEDCTYAGHAQIGGKGVDLKRICEDEKQSVADQFVDYLPDSFAADITELKCYVLPCYRIKCISEYNRKIFTQKPEGDAEEFYVYGYAGKIINQVKAGNCGYASIGSQSRYCCEKLTEQSDEYKKKKSRPQKAIKWSSLAVGILSAIAFFTVLTSIEHPAKIVLLAVCGTLVAVSIVCFILTAIRAGKLEKNAMTNIKNIMILSQTVIICCVVSGLLRCCWKRDGIRWQNQRAKKRELKTLIRKNWKISPNKF